MLPCLLMYVGLRFFMYSTRTATVTVTYTDNLTDGGRGEGGSTCIVYVPLQLL